MKSFLKNSVRRARPLLGTIVEIRAAGDEEFLPEAVNAAFGEIERLQGLMSFHEAASDVSRLNREAHDRAVTVASETWSVLAMAQEISSASEGVFDITVASRIMDWGYLPANFKGRRAIGHRFIELLPRCRVRFSRPILIDLGGIAKGFIVDRAAEVLGRYEKISGIVNAGGDLRAFGKMKWPVSIRHPLFPGRSTLFCELQEGAMATSGICFSRKRIKKDWVSPIVDTKHAGPFLKRHSLTVMADTCVVADALTKVVAVDPQASKEILARFQAKAFITGVDGTAKGLN